MKFGCKIQYTFSDHLLIKHALRGRTIPGFTDVVSLFNFKDKETSPEMLGCQRLGDSSTGGQLTPCLGLDPEGLYNITGPSFPLHHCPMNPFKVTVLILCFGKLITQIIINTYV